MSKMEHILRWLPPKLADALEIKRLITFSLVGILATFVYYLVLLSMVELMDMPVLFATSIAFIVVTIENYLLHYKWTFRSTNAHKNSFPRFVLMSMGGFTINWFIMYTGAVLLVFDYLLIQAVAILLVVMWNFILSLFWIFDK